MNKQDVLNQIKTAHQKMLTAIEGLSPDDMLRIGAAGIWSVKDILAHLTAWQSELVTALARLPSNNNAPHIVEIEDIDEWNQEQYTVNVRRGLDVILEDFHGVHKHLIKAVEALDDKLLTNPRKFPWMEGEPLSYLIAENAFWHEAEHAEDILRWRQENNI